MIKSELYKKIDELGLSPEEYIVVGSGVLCALELTDEATQLLEAEDIDIVVTEEIYDTVQNDTAYREYFSPFNSEALYQMDGVDVGKNIEIGDKTYSLDELKSEEIVIDGIPFINLSLLMAWKQKANRPKDHYHIRLIADYLEKGK